MKINNYKSAFWLFVAGLVFFILGKIFFEIYNASPKEVIDIQRFQKVFSQKEKQAQQTIAFLQQKIDGGTLLDSLENIDFQGNNILYFVYNNNRVVFWSDNLIVPNNGIEFEPNTTKYIKTPNNNCVYICRERGDVKIVALILLKFSYSAESETLNSHFVNDFRTNSDVLISQGNASDIFAVFGSNHQYLFSLQMPFQPVFTDFWLGISFFAYLIFFLVFFAFYALIPKMLQQRLLTFPKFLLLVASFALLTFVMIYYQIPGGFFGGANLIFKFFAVGGFLKECGNFIIFSFYCISTIYLLNFIRIKKNIKKNKFIFFVAILAFFLCFLLFSNILRNIILNSQVQISILKLEDTTFVRIFLHVLFAIWAVAFIFLFFKLFGWIRRRRDFLFAILVNVVFICVYFLFSKIYQFQNPLLFCLSFAALLTMFLLILWRAKKINIYSNILNAIFIAVIMGLFVMNIFYFEKEHRLNQFRTVAQQILEENTDETNIQNAQLIKLNTQIAADRTLKNLVTKPHLFEEAKHYFEDKYLTDNLSNYESAISVYKKNSVDFVNYQNLIYQYGAQISKSDFYQISAPQSSNSFVGIFPLKTRDSLFLVVNLETVRNFRSYSFPNLLNSNYKNEYFNLNISTAKYTDGNLTASTGNFNYPSTTFWFSNIKDRNSSFSYNGCSIFVFTSTDGKNFAVVTDLKNHLLRNYIIYFFYGFLMCFSITWLAVWTISTLIHKQLKINIITRFQHLFLILFLLSFVGVFILSSEFIKRRYREQQISAIDNKMTYIQKVLQEKYFYNLTLTDLESGSLANDLHDLSYTFQTDLHIFDNNGILIATTQPIIFNKNLISRRIAPKILFSNRNALSQKEQIGNLNYLVNYSEFFNGDNIQIGYIAIPQYFSEIDINAEMQNFLRFIIHIYVIALVIALIFSNIIRHQLSKPLLNLENKLRQMRLGKRNEKIEYKSNDEISQLVEQYNITVDELERSAQLLAQSERESAWKLMALQIAHEINNPLTPMKLSIQQLQRTKQMGDAKFDDYFNKSTQMLVEQIDNLSHIAETFSSFAKLPEAKYEKTNLNEKIASVVELFKNNDKNIVINYLYPKKDVFVFIDSEQIQRVLSNLIKNAIDAIPEKQTEKLIEISLQNIDNKAIITVSDNGIGISSEIAEKLFVPSFTTKSAGMGLGLAISKSIIETAGGTISFSSKIGKGSVFTIALEENGTRLLVPQE